MDNLYFGIVEDIDDPEKLGRIKVRCVGIHDKNLSNVPLEALPWLHCLTSNFAQISGIGSSNRYLRGSLVVCHMYNDVQNGVVLGAVSTQQTNAINTNEGFNDPQGNYPKELNESFVNRLARNDNINNTIVEDKKNNRDTGIPRSNDNAAWDEPESTYAAVYPYNQVTESEAGHIFEVDDTEGAARLHTYHKSGTFKEIDDSGNKVQKIVSNNYEIIAGDDFVYIKGSTNLTVDGNSNVYVLGNTDLQVDGNVNQVIGGNVTQEIGGNVDQTVAQNVSQTIEGNVTQDINGDVTQDVAGDVNATVAGSMTANVSGGTTIDTPQTTITGNATIQQNLTVLGATALSATVTSNGKDISDTHTHEGSPTAPSGPQSDTGEVK